MTSNNDRKREKLMAYMDAKDKVQTMTGQSVADMFYDMTLRDWFAGRALAIAWDAKDKGYFDGGNEDLAECAYQIADAMIAARDAK